MKIYHSRFNADYWNEDVAVCSIGRKGRRALKKFCSRARRIIGRRYIRVLLREME